MVKKFIDAEILIDELSASCMPIFEKGISGILGDEQSIADVIREQPSADVQEVVRCKDCKYLNSNAYCEGNHPDFYCSDGERMDGDTNT